MGDLQAAEQAAKYEDAMWMLSNGETFERAAARLGMTTSGLEKLLSRHQQRAS